MKTIMHVVLGDRDDPDAEITVSDPRTVPNVGDAVDFCEVTEEGKMGRVSERVFRFLPYHTEIEIVVRLT
ncbi:MAG: hypothetical protein WAU68_16450 [Vitreimonas sp.]